MDRLLLKTGGPAHPFEDDSGMSVRQVYQAHALQSLMLVVDAKETPASVAKRAANIADAMIVRDNEFNSKLTEELSWKLPGEILPSNGDRCDVIISNRPHSNFIYSSKLQCWTLKIGATSIDVRVDSGTVTGWRRSY